MEYMICGQVNKHTITNYRGMDRNGLIWKDVCANESIVEEVETLCQLAKTEEIVIELYKRIVSSGYEDFDLLKLGKVKNSEEWTFLGYDVGEKDNLDNKWSAIFKYDHYTTYEKVKAYFERLSENGLFDTLEEAEDFRKFYINESNDDVLLLSSYEKNRTLYQVAAVYRYARAEYKDMKNNRRNR